MWKSPLVMRPYFSAFLLSTLLLAGCGPQGREQAKEGNVLVAKNGVPASGEVSSSAASDLQRLMRTVETENEHCRGGHGDERDTMRACNRRQKLLFELERRGWCFEETGEVPWQRCVSDPDYRPGQYGEALPSSEEKIRTAAEDRAARSMGAPVELYNEVKRLNAACVAAGGGVSGSPDCDASIVKEEQLLLLGYCIDYTHEGKLSICDEFSTAGR